VALDKEIKANELQQEILGKKVETLIENKNQLLRKLVLQERWLEGIHWSFYNSSSKYISFSLKEELSDDMFSQINKTLFTSYHSQFALICNDEMPVLEKIDNDIYLFFKNVEQIKDFVSRYKIVVDFDKLSKNVDDKRKELENLEKLCEKFQITCA